MFGERVIPHEHSCTVCKKVDGCDNKSCQRTDWDVCESAECRRIAAAATVHRYTESETLPCCGVPRKSTPIGDRMSSDPRRITCAGPPKSNPADTGDEVPTNAGPALEKFPAQFGVRGVPPRD